ncbi:TetR/AcrR family transcriptional regulator [Runella slithyformis]|uniref:Regulatory protein TetR n=1 Tax=Runella slithyformis (strain ATCC 29530 / DSM 19594 / LMG 11500 / NCIMB 11436 / LSU 4) TaxID=761193 RepID=A0A7U3ZHR0_RUNSL|nr:TetR/AcrR family transcriptional regulator [Runella slithyformis]AEI47405.1 regulatory protein TetR [Runella slithyformis DSM 19594]
MRERILEKAQELFFRFGVKSVTMDDIARELGISKKTIYQHFEDKNSMVCAGVKHHFECDHFVAEKIHNEAPNPIAEAVMGAEMMRQTMSGLNPSAIFDIKKYYPQAWDLFSQYKKEFVLDMIRKNLIKGIEMGLYRSNVNVEVVSRLRLEQIEMGLDPYIFPLGQFNPLDTQLELLDHFLRGIVTPEGLNLYEEYTKKQLSMSISLSALLNTKSTC